VGEVIWVETLSRHRDVLSRQRFELGAGGEAFLGRGYDNDVIVDDPFVAPRHLRVFRDETGRLVAEDLGSMNGLFLDHETTKRSRLALDGETPIRIGRTWLRVRDASSPVAPEREEPQAARTWHAVFALTAFLIGLTLFETWIEDTGESKLSTYVFPLFLVGAFMLAWTTAWAVIARIFAGFAHFDRHLLIATIGFLAWLLVFPVAEQLAYSFSLTSLSPIEAYGSWIWLAVTSFFHLREIAARHLVLKGAIVGTLASLGIAGQMVTQAETGNLFGSPVAVTALKPPATRLASPKTMDEFFEGAKGLEARLDRARTEEQPTSSLLDELGLDE
jgi:hypothetical protein